MIENFSAQCLALVVTHNRLQDLKVAIEALHNQTYNHLDILVVNNGSVDGTKEWLQTQSDLIVINQDNLGGAGGFYAGMEYMINHEYQWLFMMDDDGIPDSNEISSLVNAYNEICKDKMAILNALVIDKDNHNRTSFYWKPELHIPENVNEIIKLKYINGNIHPFNGTFVHRDIINRIGLIKKEMFIWGDEQEYIARAVHNGIDLITVTSAIHYHPKEKGKVGNIFPFIKRFKVLLKPKHLSHYYYRNEGYINKKYPHKKTDNLVFVTAYTLRFLLHFEFKEWAKFIKYYIRGRNNDYR